MIADRKKNSSKIKNIRIGRTTDRPYWMMMLSIIVRAAHQIGAAVCLGAFLLGADLPWPYLLLAGTSGCLLMLTEALRHRQLLREAVGVVTLVKTGIIGMALHGWIPAVPAVLFAFVLASFYSHAPKTVRHRIWF
jgi:CHASE2 domain-containing sensor protein